VAHVTTIGVLSLQGGVREHINALNRCGVHAVPVKSVEQLESVQGLVLPGGESTTIIKLATQYDMVTPMKNLVASGFPVLGSCAGMILLADHIQGGTMDQETFGGIDVVVQRNAFGRQSESFEAPVLLQSDPQEFPGVFIRAPLVVSHGANVEVISTIGAGTHAGRIVGIAQENLMATAFHPELTNDLRVHQKFVDLVKRSQ
jgi:pyridoxal 5'-phosphate synthase pdxT subunit